MDANGYSLSDIASAVDGMGGGNNSMIWIIILFLFFFGGGNGFGNTKTNTATVEDLSQAFSFNDMADKLDGITNGLCDGFYAQNTTMLNGFNGVNQSIIQQTNALNQSIASVASAVSTSQYEIAEKICSSTQAVLDAISTNRMADMQNQINQLQLQAALGNVVRNPVPAYSVGLPYNSCSSCGNV